MGEIREFSSRSKKKKKKTDKEVKTFLDKPMYEMTIKDSLILHASTVVISVGITLIIQGWTEFGHDISHKVKKRA